MTSRLIGGQGTLIASDILEMDSIPDVTFIQGDFTEDAVLAQILEAVGKRGRPCDFRYGPQYEWIGIC